MKPCWLCKEQCDINSAGICVMCNQVYTMVQTISKLTEEELEEKILDIRRRLAVHVAVKVNKGETFAEKARQAHKFMKET